MQENNSDCIAKKIFVEGHLVTLRFPKEKIPDSLERVKAIMESSVQLN